VASAGESDDKSAELPSPRLPLTSHASYARVPGERLWHWADRASARGGEAGVVIHDLRDKDGRVFAFEIDNLLIGRLGVCKVVESIPEARVVERPRLFARSQVCAFCVFEVSGIAFVAEEPFGDDSRYWIGPEPPRWVAEIEVVRAAFSRT
jgi:hypothetical protein